jgi:putative tryptophan/tyrosine transport system substrate-binding protein
VKLLRCITIWLWALGALGALGCNTSWSAEIVILSSERSAGYVEAGQAALSELTRAGVKRGDVAQLVTSEMGATDWAAAQETKVWLTLGSDALSRALQRDGRPAVVAALIPRQSFDRIVRAAPRATNPAIAVYLDQPLGRQVDLLHLALPSVQKVGALWGSESIAQQAELQAALQARNLKLVNGYFTAGNTLFSALRPVLDEAQALLAVADPEVYNGSTVSNILLATYRSQVPVMAFSPAYVNAGALLALYSTPRQIGTQAAGVVRQVQLGGATVVASQYPADFSVAVNTHVARSLGFTLDEVALAVRLQKLERRQ